MRALYLPDHHIFFGDRVPSAARGLDEFAAATVASAEKDTAVERGISTRMPKETIKNHRFDKSPGTRSSNRERIPF